MAERKYTYDPTKIKEKGKDRMRFELGDTMVEGGAETAALSDEEINAVLEMYPNKWKKPSWRYLKAYAGDFHTR